MKISNFINLNIITGLISIFALPSYWIEYFNTYEFSSRWGTLKNNDALIAIILFSVLFVFLILNGALELKKIFKAKK